MNKKIHRSVQLISGPDTLWRRIRWLLRQPIFLFVTLWGHLVVLGGMTAFYHFEMGANPRVHSLFDSLFWAVGTVTAVGTDIQPVTFSGEVVDLFVMILGSLFLWSYAALFVGALVSPEIRVVEDEVREFTDVEKKIRWDQKRIESTLEKMEALLEKASDLHKA